MSRFSLSSTLALFQSVTAADPDATSSSTSSNSAINNSSNSLSISPSGAALITPTTLYEQQIREPFKLANFKQQHQPNISNHLLELQREIKEEEEEIFADINSLINNRSHLYSSFDDDTDDFDDNTNACGLADITTSASNVTSTTISCHPFSITDKNSARHQDSYLQEDEDQGLGHDSDLTGDESLLEQNHQFLAGIEIDKRNDTTNNNNNQYRGQHNYAPCNQTTTGQQLQSLDEQQSEQQELQEHHQQQQYLELENQQLKDQERRQHQDEQLHTEDEYQAIQRDIQQLTTRLPKPCVFFLEGNCRRSDCKYSHDLSSITCKYWIDGFCFKGEMCPFLHSYSPKGQDSGLLDDDLALTKKELNPTFVIESEADFPSLPLDAPEVTIGSDVKKKLDSTSLTKTIKNQILSSNPAVVFKTTKKKRRKG